MLSNKMILILEQTTCTNIFGSEWQISWCFAESPLRGLLIQEKRELSLYERDSYEKEK